jgi:hypothetical protein
MKLSEILTGPETWCQETYTDEQGRVCIMEALRVLSEAERWDSDRSARERKRLAAIIGGKTVTSDQIAAWNDVRRRTWEQIMEVRDAYDRDRLLNP